MDSAEARAAAFIQPGKVVDMLRVRPGAQLADLGAGSGEYAIALAKKVGNTGHVYAVDVQKELLSRISSAAQEEGLENVDVIWGDIDAPGGTRIKDGLLDLVLVSNALFQFEEKEAAFAEMHRILKAGGKLAIVEWSESFGNIGPHRNDVVPAADAKKLADAAGFAFADEFEPGSHHYGLLFTRT